MKERTESILGAALQSFIKSGKPVTSESLYDIYDFGIKPAMIRWELQALSDDGFFYQTHPSGGRFPTDKAYRFFVDDILDRELTRAFAGIREVMKPFLHGEPREFVSDVADHLKILSVGYESEDGEMYESGFADLLRGLELSEKRDLLQVVSDFESLQDKLDEKRTWWQREREWPQVFIGESPLTKSEHLSLIADKLVINGSNFMLVAIGPKRMDYQKSLQLFKSIEQALEL